MHGEIRRAPSACWQDGGGKKRARTSGGQAEKLVEDRQLQVSKAAAPFVKTANSSHYLVRKSTELSIAKIISKYFNNIDEEDKEWARTPLQRPDAHATRSKRGAAPKPTQNGDCTSNRRANPVLDALPMHVRARKAELHGLKQPLVL